MLATRHGHGPGCPWQLDPAQRTVVDLSAGHGPVLVLGAPGTGRSTVGRRGGGASDRRGHGPPADPRATSASPRPTLRDLVSRRAAATISTPPVRAWQAYAFDVLRRAQSEGLMPGIDLPRCCCPGRSRTSFLAEHDARSRRWSGGSVALATSRTRSARGDPAVSCGSCSTA
ncbi:hypothetical protein QJS66_22395 [Kocuria rhizophila]|nr:hypothetical protein QJS66_22395 [Kocuria rhizophila]